MVRLILLALFVSVIVIAVISVESLLRRNDPPLSPSKESTMPGTFRNLAYAALIVLMFGVVTGWLVVT